MGECFRLRTRAHCCILLTGTCSNLNSGSGILLGVYLTCYQLFFVWEMHKSTRHKGPDVRIAKFLSESSNKGHNEWHRVEEADEKTKQEVRAAAERVFAASWHVSGPAAAEAAQDSTRQAPSVLNRMSTAAHRLLGQSEAEQAPSYAPLSVQVGPPSAVGGALHEKTQFLSPDQQRLAA